MEGKGKRLLLVSLNFEIAPPQKARMSSYAHSGNLVQWVMFQSETVDALVVIIHEGPLIYGGGSQYPIESKN